MESVGDAEFLADRDADRHDLPEFAEGREGSADGLRRWREAESSADGGSGEVFAVEDVAHAGVVEDGAECFGDQRRNREYLEVRELLLCRERQ